MKKHTGSILKILKYDGPILKILLIVICAVVCAVLLVSQLRGDKTIDQLQTVLQYSFEIHGALFGAYLLRKPFARPLYSVVLGAGLLLVAFLLGPYGYAYGFGYHSDIWGRLISAVSPALIIAGMFAISSAGIRITPSKRPITPAA